MEDEESEGACASRGWHLSTQNYHSPRKTPEKKEKKIRKTKFIIISYILRANNWTERRPVQTK